MADWGRWGKGLLVAAAAIVTGAFATKTYDVKVRQIGRRFAAGERTLRRGRFDCARCGARVWLDAGAEVPTCAACGHTEWIKAG